MPTMAELLAQRQAGGATTAPTPAPRTLHVPASPGKAAATVKDETGSYTPPEDVQQTGGLAELQALREENAKLKAQLKGTHEGVAKAAEVLHTIGKPAMAGKYPQKMEDMPTVDDINGST